MGGRGERRSFFSCVNEEAFGGESKAGKVFI